MTEVSATPYCRYLLRQARVWVTQAGGEPRNREAALRAIEEALCLLGDPSKFKYLSQADRDRLYERDRKFDETTGSFRSD